ncbi:MAG: branched-chain amino acid transporter permease [Oligoflexales bacterium]
MDDQFLLYLVIGMGLCNFVLRAFPFIFRDALVSNPIFTYLGSYLPPAIMLILVAFCFKDVEFVKYPFGIPEMLAVIIVAGLHLWKRQSLLSIGFGTAFYIFMVNHSALIP